MVGAINELLKEVIVRDYSESTWSEIKFKLNLDEDIFLSFKEYPDNITYGVIKEFDTIMNGKGDHLLYEVGKYAINKFTKDGISAGLSTGGQTFEDFILNAPEMNERTQLLNPKQPSSELNVEKIGEREYKLFIESEIQGFNYMIKGMLESIGKDLYHEEVQVKIGTPNNTTTHVFYVKW